MTAPREAPRDDAAADRPPSRWFRIAFAIAMIVVAFGYAWLWQLRTERIEFEPPPPLALAGATSHISADSADADRLLERLAAELDRVPRLTLVAPDARADSARVQLLYAALSNDGPGHRLEVRRVNAKTDAVIYTYRVTGATLDEAVYRMSVQIAMSLGLPRPEPLGAR